MLYSHLPELIPWSPYLLNSFLNGKGCLFFFFFTSFLLFHIVFHIYILYVYSIFLFHVSSILFFFLLRFWLRSLLSLLLGNHPWAPNPEDQWRGKKKPSAYHCVAIRSEIWHPVMSVYQNIPKYTKISWVPNQLQSDPRLSTICPWFVSHWMRHTSKVFSGPVQDDHAFGSSPLENREILNNKLILCTDY